MVGFVVDEEQSTARLEVFEQSFNDLRGFFLGFLLFAVCAEFAIEYAAFVALQDSWFKGVVVGNDQAGVQAVQ